MQNNQTSSFLKKKSDRVIFIISGKNLSSSGGYANYAYHLAQTTHALGFTVHVFYCGQTSGTTKANFATFHSVGSKILTFPLLKNIEMAVFPFLSVGLARILHKNAKAYCRVLVWGVGPWSLAGAMLKSFSKKYKVTLLTHYATTLKHEFSGTLAAVTVNDYGLLEKIKARITYVTIIQIYTYLEKFLLMRSNRIITHYASTEKILMKEFHIKPSAFTRIPYAPSKLVKGYTSNNIRLFVPPRPFIITICRQDGRKGINFLLHACALLNKKGIQYSLVIVGDGMFLEANRKLARKLHLENVYFLGFVADTIPLLKNASLFVFPSIEEGNSSLALLEAMKQGLPIVATNIDGIPEDIQQGKSGLLVPPRNPKALAEAIEKLLTNKPLAQKLGKEARKRYYKKHNAKKIKEEITKLLKSLHYGR